MGKMQRCAKTGRYLSNNKFDYVGGNIKSYGVYQITNKVNGKIYIGSCFSNTFKTRWLKHLERLNKGKHSNSHLQSAWKMYGEDNFLFTIVEELERDKDIILNREQWYLDNYIVWQHDYNQSETACGGRKSDISQEFCLEVLNYYLNSEVFREDVVNKFNISITTVSRILRGCHPNSRDLPKELFYKTKEKGKLNMVKAKYTEKGLKKVLAASIKRNKEARSVTKEQAIEIYNTYNDCDIVGKRKFYAEKYGTNESTIGDIVSGRTYNDWTGAPEYLKKRYKEK